MPRAIRATAALLPCLAVAFVAGCGLAFTRPAANRPPEPPASWSESVFERKTTPSYAITAPRDGSSGDTVIGAVATYRVREGDTLFDVARYYDLGENEIEDANPGVDRWIPKPGTELVLPTQWVLPCCSYDGIVVNIPEMRLYHFSRSKGAADRVTVRTYPVGLGRDDRRTPRGTFRVSGKTVNPTWNIPESIRKEHIRERGDARRAIAGGAPDNPLGSHRIELASSLYSIHGTDIPWGVGMLVSHGCIRLYPEDIARWFPDVPVGTPVRFVYQPVKAGSRGGATYVEVHSDVYKQAGSLASAAQQALERRKLGGAVDRKALQEALAEPHGVPVQVSAPAGRQARADTPLDARRR
ncbi:MAG TPA: L,D-transpeptidase family protein [Candidatus Binatia bacterium]|nr:L,D-transpeptidase family protein [Candidatus Binatia bacterium]